MIDLKRKLLVLVRNRSTYLRRFARSVTTFISHPFFTVESISKFLSHILRSFLSDSGIRFRIFCLPLCRNKR